MTDREKYIEVLSKTAKTVKEFNEDAPIKISLECIEDILELLKEQDEMAKTIDELYEILNDVCKDVREETEEDYVCGLCEYDGAHKTESGDWAGECPGFESADCFCMKNEIRKMCGKELI